MHLKFSAVAGVLLLIFISCNDQRFETAKSQEAPVDKIDQLNYSADSTAEVAKDFQQPPGSENQPVSNIDWNKKIIRNGTINLEVQDYSKYYQVLKDIVRREGGYIAQENQQQTDYRLENTVLLKVPVAQFEQTMDLITQGTGKEEVNERKITSEDVTTEVVDTKSRIEAKKEVRLRYIELLRQAKTMKDILEVQSEINQIQEQMEMASGRVNYLNHASAYSTINLTFYQILSATPPKEKEPSFSNNILTAFLSGWQFIKAIIVGLISIWPLWFLVFGVWVAYKKWKLSKPKSA